MGKPVLIYGKSGSGKSRSLKNFDEDEIFLVQVIKKDLPFRKKFKYTMHCRDVDTIAEKLEKMPCKCAVIDDAGYLQTDMFMSRHSNLKKGTSSFDLFNEISDIIWKLLNRIIDLPDDVLVYIIMHESSNDYGEIKLRTIGKLLDDKVCIEGMSTVSLRCITVGGKHYFRTQTDGNDISKSPEEMFETLLIDNDLKMVDTAIRNFK